MTCLTGRNFADNAEKEMSHSVKLAVNLMTTTGILRRTKMSTTKSDQNENLLLTGCKYHFDSVFGLKQVVAITRWPARYGQMKGLFYMYDSKKPWIFADYVIKDTKMLDLYNIVQKATLEQVMAVFPKGYSAYLPPWLINKGIKHILEENGYMPEEQEPIDGMTAEQKEDFLKHNLGPVSLFKALLEEEGIFGYEMTILNWVEAIWGLNLQ